MANEADLLGHTIEGKYQLSAVLGRGGMGTVYEATHRLTNRRVAVKVLLPEQAEKPDAIARFHHEARVVSALGHTHICEVLDFGRLPDGRPFLVMERLEGETLGERLDRKVRLDLVEAVVFVRQALLALEAAHAHGVIHRDMKPDNVFLVRREGSAPIAKVLDFGVSKAMGDDRDVELTRTGMVMGTPYYMAPEQARGDRNLDGRVDVWAVGVLLYEALTGTRPFVAKNYNALLVQILTARHRSSVELNPRIPRGLEAVIDCALAKRREDRFPTVAAFGEALAPFERHGPARGVRPRLDRFVEVGGVPIPVTWEDTGGETPASAGARVIEAKALGTASDPPGEVRPAGGQAGSLPPHGVGRVGARAGATPPAVTFRPGQPPRPERRGGSAEPRPSREVPGGPPVAAEPARRTRPPVEDEDTTKVLAGGEASSEAATPAVRTPATSRPPNPGFTSAAAPPPETRSEGPARASAPVPSDDIETTIVDLDPPTFSTDSYRVVKDRKES